MQRLFFMLSFSSIFVASLLTSFLTFDLLPLGYAINDFGAFAIILFLAKILLT
jgi:hypothetical protein